MKFLFVFIIFSVVAYSQTYQYQIIKNESSGCKTEAIPNDLFILNLADSTFSYNQNDSMISHSINNYAILGDHIILYYALKDTFTYRYEDTMDFNIEYDKLVTVTISSDKLTDEGTITYNNPVEPKCTLIRRFRPSEVLIIP
ncbi:MAG TPA: hypothetical protein PLT92_05390 [Ignavibacteriaceae bacterium]|nr:hypothetical protein [Ignavibacteriaceae bacterium]HOJ17977.1 hypothetical protein [Ignavibacteriaceae bacterium]HPO54916.1 hypothetical protein [Ignavibacteriaceae bacterium]